MQALSGIGRRVKELTIQAVAFKFFKENQIEEPARDKVLRTLTLATVIAACLAGFLVGFTDIGWGIAVLRALYRPEAYLASLALYGGGLGVLALLYVLDFSYWTGRRLRAAKACAFALVLALWLCGAVVSVRKPV